MCRVRILQTALCALVLQGLNPSPTMAAVRIEIDPAEVVIEVESRDVERPPVQGDDGSAMVAGHLGTQAGCPGVQAYLTRYHDDGSIAWTKSACAGKDCDGDGNPDGGDPLFEHMTSIDPAYIQSSTAHESVFGPDGSTYTTGQFLLAWGDGPEPTVVWGGFVLHFGVEGEHLGDVYLGPPIDGPPAEALGCEALCSALGNTSLTQWGGRELAWLDDQPDYDGGLVLAGWIRSAANGGADGKDVFLTVITPDLGDARWFRIFAYPGDDVPLDVAVAANGDIYSAGRYGESNDAWVGRFYGRDGTPTHFFLGGGPYGDWSEEIEIHTDGTVQVTGTFTEQATFSGQALTGNGTTGFSALLTAELELIEIETTGGNGGGGGGQTTTIPPQTANVPAPLNGQPLPPPPPPGGPPGEPTHNEPSGIEVLVGTVLTGTDPTQVASIDDDYLKLFGEYQPEHKKVEIVFEIPISPQAPSLKSVKLQFQSESCTNIQVYLGGGAALPDVYHGIGGAALCPHDESLITIDIPSDIAEIELGYTATSQPTEPLLVLVTLESQGHNPLCGTAEILCSSGEDEEFNMASAESEEFP